MTNFVLLLAGLVFVELLMHALYVVGLLPQNPIFMTLLEKSGYRPNVNRIVYEDAVPRRAQGYATYAQRGIPPQFVEFDAHGMRVDGYAGGHPADRVVGVFGDSYTDALQVGQAEAWPAILEGSLRREGCDVDFRNYGIGASGTTIEYLRYRQRKAAGEVFDLVVLAFFQNDIINNERELDQLFHKSYVEYPYFRLEDGQLVRADWSRPPGRRSWEGFQDWLYRYSHVANAVFNLSLIYKAGQRAAAGAAGDQLLTRRGAMLEMDRLYGPPQTPAWTRAWDVTEAVIRQWSQEARADGERFLLVLLTESSQLAPSARSGLDYDYPNRRLTDFAEAEGISVFDFLPAARQAVRSRELEYPYLSWEFDGHYSQLGHALLAERLQPVLAAQLGCNQ